ncbi:MAG: DUF3592 domain-containing protein [Ginsengibacter sp.]
MFINPIYSILFIVLTIILTYFIVKRSGRKGCVTFVYIGLVIFCTNLFTIGSWGMMYSSIKEVFFVVTSGQKYTATVVSFTKKTDYNSKDNRYDTMYQPTVKFTLLSGKVVEKTLEFSESSMKIGDHYKVNYDEASDKTITLGFILIIKLVGVFLFWFILTFLTGGIIKYSLGQQMDNYKALVSKISFYFFIPFLMIGFDCLLIYAIFYGNPAPWFVTALIVFFIVMLSLATWGYIKMIIKKGEPKMRRAGPNKWVGDWDDN